MELVSGGSDINGATPSSFFCIGAFISIGREIRCLPYAEFLFFEKHHLNICLDFPFYCTAVVSLFLMKGYYKLITYYGWILILLHL